MNCVEAAFILDLIQVRNRILTDLAARFACWR
jgi:hypothetical protein